MNEADKSVKTSYNIKLIKIIQNGWTSSDSEQKKKEFSFGVF